MSQTYETLVSGTTTFGQLYGKINNLAEALRSCFCGNSFPTTPSPTIGQLCFRTDLNKLYVFTSSGWKEVAIELTGLGAEIINARGTKPTLDQRLDVAMNEDGTLKASTSLNPSQWVSLTGYTFEYVTPTTFTVNGSHTDIYVEKRRLKINLLDSMAYTEVVSSSYDSNQDKTTVQTLDAVLEDTIVSVEHLIISPDNFNFVDASTGIEVGRPSSTTTPYIDFHSSGNDIDYDVRVQATGGSSSLGDGIINIIASKAQVNSNDVWHAGNMGSGSGLDADKVDGYHASQTPAPNVIVPLDANGILDLSATYVKSNVYTFRRVDLTDATSDYMLQVGEEAYISFSNTMSVPLRIATQSGTYYECHLVCNNTGGTSGGTSGSIYLNPNNTTYSDSFIYAELYRDSGMAHSNYFTYSAFRCGHMFVSSLFYITNFVQYKNVKGIYDIYGLSNTYPCLDIFSTDWQDTTTSWTSLGTIVFPQNSSGYILVQRIL